MKTLSTNCKFCGKPVWMECDEDGLAFLNPEVWLKKIACNRCGDYKVNLRKTENAIYSVCQLLRGCRQNMVGSKRLEMESKVREKLDSLTKRFCCLVCDYFRITNLWDSAVPEMIFNKPDRAGNALSVYLKTIAKEAAAPA